ncbi:MAG: rRNA pseudouridine synthase [Clostridiales bacterium]|nr:rRNA pseudouridine synthase [Clostridiales bacterium]
MRLQKYMADCAVASRRASEQLILQGRVAINGVTVTELGTKVNEGDKVTFDGNVIKPVKKRVYIMLNKPDKVMSTVSDPEGRTTVLDLIEEKTRLYPVGRLDYHTEGLILLVNDGDVAYHLTHPKFEIEKEYLVTIQGEISREEVLKLQSGVIIDGQKTAPSKVRVTEVTDHTTSLSVIIHEGRNRQVRKMFEAINKKVIHLTRFRHGELVLTGLKPGQWRYLNDEEITYLENLK